MTRDLLVAIQMRSPEMAMLVPLAANAPSFSSAGGSPSPIRLQCAPPSSVLMITSRPSTLSLNAKPCRASRNAIASKKACGCRYS